MAQAFLTPSQPGFHRRLCPGAPLFRDDLFGHGLEAIGGDDLLGLCGGSRHHLETRIEIDHGRRQLRQDADVACDLRGAIGNLRRKGLCSHHGLFEIRAVDGQRQVGLFGLEAGDVGQRGVVQLDDEFLAIVGRSVVVGVNHSCNNLRP